MPQVLQLPDSLQHGPIPFLLSQRMAYLDGQIRRPGDQDWLSKAKRRVYLPWDSSSFTSYQIIISMGLS
jgi:hypothetical protein